ncbi:MAG TPA: DUF1549 domain-containing protein [Gemmataceae bacterium]|nr:DUF1549 domain-containing protein [Gemmataceae bacterium]
MNLVPDPSHPGRWFKVLSLAGICVASMLVGGFMLPGPRTAAIPGAAAREPVAEPAKPTPVVVGSPSAAAAVAPPAPLRPRRSPHPLDAAPVVVPQSPAGPAYELAALIDREIDAALAAAKVPASPLADDAEFLRRVSLDLTGTVPSYDRTIAFLMDGDPQKRAKLIDELLSRPEYGQLFARQWADLLIKRDFDSNKRLDTGPFTNWLAGKLNAGAGWDAIVRDILTASGNESETPQDLFYLANQDNMQPSPAKLVGATGNLFMGVQIQCAECHVHPTVDKWSQKDFWGMAAFFAHVVADREKGEKNKPVPGTAKIHEVEKKAAPRPQAAKKSGEKEVKPGGTIAIPDPTDNKKTVGTAKAKFFEGPMPALRGAPYRPTMANWVVSNQNKYFAANAVNRLWTHLFARGLVQPVEEMNDANPPSHPAVLAALADALVKNGYDQKFVLRAICNTRAYQRTSRPLPENAEAEEKLFARMPVKVIGAHELLDSLATVTHYHEPDPAGRRPMRPMLDNPKRPPGPVTLTRFFDTREYDDDLTDFPFGVPQLLKLMNTNLTTRAGEVATRIAKAAGSDKARVIEDLYLTALARRPKPAELERMLAYVEKQGNPQRGYAGVMWALLNSAEFVSNH